MPEGTINGEPFKVPVGYTVASEEDLWRGHAAIELLADLDRSPHGRYRGDAESQSSTGRSEGNPFLSPGTRIGTTIGGRPIIVPRGGLGDPKSWHD